MATADSIGNKLELESHLLTRFFYDVLNIICLCSYATGSQDSVRKTKDEGRTDKEKKRKNLRKEEETQNNIMK